MLAGYIARECCDPEISVMTTRNLRIRTYQALSVSADGGQHRSSNLLHDALDFGDLVLQRDILVLRLLGVSRRRILISARHHGKRENATYSSFPILIEVV